MEAVNTKRYDRQIRLWGENGQIALERARVCLINATPAGCELLKNLILPGIGSFVIVDGGLVGDADVASNFFVTEDTVNRPRAAVVKELLSELNPQVKGEHVEQSLMDVMQKDPEFMLQFTLIVCCSEVQDHVVQLSRLIHGHNIPLVVIQTNGFFGTLRVSVGEHVVVETHPENLNDFRLDRPWPELQAYVDGFHLESLNTYDLAHVPYVVLLIKYLEAYKKVNGNTFPSNYREKNAFKQFIRDHAPVKDEENFEEAISAVLRACQETSVPSVVQSIFQDTKCQQITVDSSKFWIMARAVFEFTKENDGMLPLTGQLPDMKSDTNNFIKLQQIYRLKAQRDAQTVQRIVQALLASIGKDAGWIDYQEIVTFCKHSAYLRIFRYSALHDQVPFPPSLVNAMSNEDHEAAIYLVFTAVESFRARFNRYPGSNDTTIQQDTIELASLLPTTDSSLLMDFCAEVCRYGGDHYHNISAIMGGIGAQEAIKLITHQFIPLNNTVVYNGIRSSSAYYQL